MLAAQAHILNEGQITMLQSGKAAETAREQPPAGECPTLLLSEPMPKSTALPVFVLFVLSPLIAEVLLGATPLTHIGGLVIVAPFYGCGVLIIRELVR